MVFLQNFHLTFVERDFGSSFFILKNFQGDLGPPVPERFRFEGGEVAFGSISVT